MQIMLPILVGVLLFIVSPLALWFSRMGSGGDVPRWAAVSTMWLLLPVWIGLLLMFVVLVAVGFLTSRIAAVLPRYSIQGQKLAKQIALGTRRGAEIVHKPVLAVRAMGNAAKAQFRRLRERA